MAICSVGTASSMGHEKEASPLRAHGSPLAFQAELQINDAAFPGMEVVASAARLGVHWGVTA